MSLRSCCLASALFLAPLSLTLPVQAIAASSGAQTYTFIFKDAEIPQVAEEILGNSLGVAYRVEPGISGKMNFSIEQRLTKVQLLAAFEAALSQYDVVMLQDGDTVVLKPRKGATVGGQITTGAQKASGIGFQIRAVPVNYGSAEEIAKALTSVSKADLVLYSSDKQGLILLGGRAEELDNALTTIALFDQSTLSDKRIRFYPLANANAVTVATDLDVLLKASGTSSVTIAPMKRLNGLFAFSQSSEVLDQVSHLIQRLDVPSQDSSNRVWVYHPHGASAESLVKTLNAVMGTGADLTQPSASSSDSFGGKSGPSSGSSSTGSSAPGTRSTGAFTTGGSSGQSMGASSGSGNSANGEGDQQGVHIVADKDTNSLIISAPEAVRVRLQSVLAEIDHEPAQIFIEASILEVTLSKDLNYGVDWTKIASKGNLTVSNYTSSKTSFTPIAPGFSINYIGDNISAAIDALSSQSKVKIVSAPKITTVENSPATLQVGDQVPIVVQSAQSTSTSTAPLVNSVDYRDTGVQLKVTPRITSENRIELDVSQEVSSVVKTVTSGIDSPTINQRKISSTLIVPEGTVVALGGMISSSDSISDNGIPGLKDIPFLGGAFKGQTHSVARTELIILLQARIMRNSSDYSALTADLSADLRDLTGQGFLNKADASNVPGAGSNPGTGLTPVPPGATNSRAGHAPRP